MTEPNIVYIGDEVRHINPCWDDVHDTAWVNGIHDNLIMTNTGGIPKSMCITHDGRLVDGFGGAKIELDTAANRWFALIQEVPLSDMWNAESEAIEDALEAACDLYGEWVREPTEADLKRRGLL